MPGGQEQHLKDEHQYLIGLDIGTSAVKGVLMSTEGTILSREKSETRYHSSTNGYTEFDADGLYGSAVEVIRRLALALPKNGSVAGLSMASASGNTVLVNDRGLPIMPAFSWMDTRVQREIQTVFGNLEESKVHELIGWPMLPMFPLAHLSWLKCHEPELLEGSARICMSTEYINFRLTGNWGIDNSTATTFYLQDQKAAQWHLPYLQQLGIPKEKLPTIHSAGTVLGQLTQDASIETVLAPGTPIVLGAFDHPCAARGAGILDEGQLLLSCGTSWVGFSPLKERQKAIDQKLLVDPFLQHEKTWGAMFSLPAIATSVDKYICKYITDAPDRYREFDRLSASAVPGAQGLIINPMLQDDSGSMQGYGKAEIARAVMEGTAFLLKMQMERLEDAGIHCSSLAMVGGPSESFPWPQITADVLGKEIVTTNGSCAGAVGAAILAGIGAGLYRDEREAFRTLAFPHITRTPDPAAHRVYVHQYRQFISKYY